MKDEVKTTGTILLTDLEVGYHKAGNSVAVFGPVNATVSRGDMVGVIGRNGIGKSTLLRTVAGLQPPVRGDVYINGLSRKETRLKDMARVVSYVSTEPVYGFQIKVIELIAMGRIPYTGWLGKLDDADREAIHNAVSLTGVAHLLNKSIQETSDGERQKVMIARALSQDTPVIILDEPTAFLDLPARYEILRILKHLAVNNGKTILFSTHDLSIAIDLADKLWLMTEDDVFQGAPEDLLISKVFRKLFLNSPAEFDPRTLTFRFSREYHGKIEIHGDKKHKALTRKAMERIGFSTVEIGSDLNIEISEVKGRPVWHLTGTQIDRVFESIFDLASFLKNH